jgi:hypothetical protein
MLVPEAPSLPQPQRDLRFRGSAFGHGSTRPELRPAPSGRSTSSTMKTALATEGADSCRRTERRRVISFAHEVQQMERHADKCSSVNPAAARRNDVRPRRRCDSRTRQRTTRRR